nr:hypothetical protein BaRGS_012763 [Batillaria attramentaria]
MKWFREVCEYNVPFGKKNRGISVVTSYRELVKDPLPADLKRARVLGWCVEWDGVGTVAINDSFFLESALYQIIRKHLKDQPYYLNILELFHEDDYLDCFGAPEVIGKIGTDIQDNKCSWLVVQALTRASAEQRQILQDNYGQHDADKVERVKALYRELELTKVYEDPLVSAKLLFLLQGNKVIFVIFEKG